MFFDKVVPLLDGVCLKNFSCSTYRKGREEEEEIWIERTEKEREEQKKKENDRVKDRVK